MNTASDQPRNAEIDLFKLFENIWKEKILIITITCVFSLAGLAYALLSTPVYQASANIISASPETQKRLSDLTLYPNIAPRPPLEEYIRTLNNPTVQASFIKEASNSARKALYPNNEELLNLQSLNKLFNIQNNQQRNRNSPIFPYKATFKAPSMALAEEELQRFLIFAAVELNKTYLSRFESLQQESINSLQRQFKTTTDEAANLRQNEITRLEEELTLSKKETELKLKAAIQSAKAHYEDRVESLTYALKTAIALKITQPSTLKGMGDRNPEISVDVNNSNDPLYLRGSKLLSAELEQLKENRNGYRRTNEIINLQSQLTQLEVNYRIEQLKARENDLPFNEELQNIRSQINKLKSESFPSIKLNFSHSPAKASPSRLKPKRTLIVLITTLLGGCIGLTAALIKSMLLKRKDKTIT